MCVNSELVENMAVRMNFLKTASHRLAKKQLMAVKVSFTEGLDAKGMLYIEAHPEDFSRAFHTTWRTDSPSQPGDHLVVRAEAERPPVETTVPSPPNTMEIESIVKVPESKPDSNSSDMWRKKERQHLCPIRPCEKRFKRHCDLVVHLRSHTGERPYACMYKGCTYRATTSSNLQKHAFGHLYEATEVDGEKVLICRIPKCTGSFRSRNDLWLHIRREHPQSLMGSGVSDDSS